MHVKVVHTHFANLPLKFFGIGEVVDLSRMDSSMFDRSPVANVASNGSFSGNGHTMTGMDSHIYKTKCGEDSKITSLEKKNNSLRSIGGSKAPMLPGLEAIN